MDTGIRTLKLETSKRGRPNAPHHSTSTGSSHRDLDARVPEELGLPSLEGRIIVRTGKRRPQWWWLKDKEGKSL